MIVRFGALGDMVLITVAIRRIYERFGSTVDVLASGAWTRPLLERQLGVGQIYVIKSRRSPYWSSPGKWRLARQLRDRGPGPTWLFDADNRMTRRLLKSAGWRDEQLIGLEQLADIAGEHFCNRWHRFASLGSPGQCLRADAVWPELTVPHHARRDTGAWLQRIGLDTVPLVLVQIGNKRTMRLGALRRSSNTKYWPLDRWAEVLRELRRLHPGHALLLLGVGREAKLNDEVLKRARVSGAYNLAHSMSVPRLMGLCERATAILSVDTGPAHVAAALSCPALVLFDSPEKMGMYLPRGPGAPVRGLAADSGRCPALLGLEPHQVIEAWCEMPKRDQPAKKCPLPGILTESIDVFSTTNSH
jgi:heptosyltransferase-2/heptosyltransferase-3